jgi:hypothetical protein
MKTIDDRNEEQKKTHLWAIVAKDRAMSYWGGAQGGVSRCAWAVPFADLDKVDRWVRARSDMSYVRPIALANYRAPKGTAHLHIYAVDQNHPALKA